MPRLLTFVLIFYTVSERSKEECSFKGCCRQRWQWRWWSCMWWQLLLVSTSGTRTVAKRHVAGRWDRDEQSCLSCVDWSWMPARWLHDPHLATMILAERRHASTIVTCAWWNGRCHHEHSPVCWRNTTCTQKIAITCQKITHCLHCSETVVCGKSLKKVTFDQC